MLILYKAASNTQTLATPTLQANSNRPLSLDLG